MKISLILICLALFAGRKVNSEEYSYRDGTVTCTCDPNDESVEFDYDTAKPVKSLEISSCATIALDSPMGNLSEIYITSMKFENIGQISILRPVLQATHLKSMEFLNVGYIAEIENHQIYNSAKKLEYFHMKNAVIGTFSHTFNTTTVDKFILSNVTVINMKNLDFWEIGKGTELKIIDSYINVTFVGVSFSFGYFDTIKIENTTFEFPYGGNIVISGTHVHLSNNVFVNGSVNVKGKRSIHLTNSCLDGRGSTFQIASMEAANPPEVAIHGNKFSCDIVNNIDEKFYDQSNTFCQDAKCNCVVSKPPQMDCDATGCTSKTNYGITVHQKTSRGILLYFIFIFFTSAIVTRI